DTAVWGTFFRAATRPFWLIETRIYWSLRATSYITRFVRAYIASQSAMPGAAIGRVSGLSRSPSGSQWSGYSRSLRKRGVWPCAATRSSYRRGLGLRCVGRTATTDLSRRRALRPADAKAPARGPRSGGNPSRAAPCVGEVARGLRRGPQRPQRRHGGGLPLGALLAGGYWPLLWRTLQHRKPGSASRRLTWLIW